MNRRGQNGMGRVTVIFTVTNNEDASLAKRGQLDRDKIRSVELEGVVDTASNYLVLPSHVVEQLGLPIKGEVGVRYADRRGARRKMAGQAEVGLLGRKDVFSAIVEPARGDALIGAIVLEALDLLVDCTNQRLVPRDPKRIIADHA
jgi:predicted aspartyl protease